MPTPCLKEVGTMSLERISGHCRCKGAGLAWEEREKPAFRILPMLLASKASPSKTDRKNIIFQRRPDLLLAGVVVLEF